MSLIYTTEAQVTAIINSIISGQRNAAGGLVGLLPNGQIDPKYIADSLGTGNGGAIGTADSPPADSVNRTYYPSATGTYTNFSGIAVDLADGLNIIIGNETDGFEKIVAPVDLAGYAETADYPNLLQLEPDILISKNLLNNQNVVGGSVNSAGSNSGSNNWINVEVPVKPNTEYTLSGVQGISTGAFRFVVLRANRTSVQSELSNGTDTQSITTDSDAAFLLINIANILNVGLDPTNSVYANTMQLEEGETATSYVPYFLGYDSSKLVNLDAEIEANSQVSSLRTFKNDVEYIGKNIFNKETAVQGNIASNGSSATGSINWCATDFIAIEPDTSYTIQGGSITTSSVLAIAWYDASQAFISGVALNGTPTRTEISPSNAAFMRCTIANAIDVGLTPTDNEFSNVFMVEKSSNATSYEPFLTSDFIRADKIFGLSLPINKAVYYSLDLDGYEGNEQLFVYVNISDDFYVGFEVVHWIDLADTVYSDQWRILRAKMYQLSSGVMVNQNIDLLANGDSEGVYRTADKSDFTGGVHGDETVINLELFASGVKISLGADIPLTGCDTFKLLQRSNTHEAPATGNVPNLSHPIETLRVKEIYFENGGYRMNNRWTWVNTPDTSIVTFYPALATTHKNAAQAGYTDLEYIETVFNGDNTNKMEGIGQRKFAAYNSTNGLGTEVTSKVITPSNLDAGCNMFIWDRVEDSKYYRDLAGNAPDTQGDVIEGEMIVKWFRL